MINKKLVVEVILAEFPLFALSRLGVIFFCQSQMGLSLQEVKEVSWVIKQLPD